MFRLACRVSSLSLVSLIVLASAAPAAELACGDPNRTGSVTSTDALLALRASVGLLYCDTCLCDPGRNGEVAASDALAILRAAVGTTTLDCVECSESICGDGLRTAFRGAPLETMVEIADCLLLSVSPDSVENSIEATLTKALDTHLETASGVAIEIDDHGCDCDFLRTARFGGGAEACNCLVTVYASSPVVLSIVEVFLNPADGYCGDFIPSGTFVIDGGVEEECDDGNLAAGDGCSPECRLEGPAASAADAAR